jgi:DNA-binding transcriptional LysR family regulator
MKSLPPPLNYHHLVYFWAVAREGHLTRAAQHLRISQSALSAQIRQLETRFGQPLFTRQGRQLVLTEAGRIALAYAETIVGAGHELVATPIEGELVKLWVFQPSGICQPLSIDIQRETASFHIEFSALTADITREVIDLK